MSELSPTPLPAAEPTIVAPPRLHPAPQPEGPPAFDLMSLLGRLGSGSAQGSDTAVQALSAAVASMADTNRALLGFMNQDRQERAELRRRVEKLEQLLAERRSGPKLDPLPTPPPT